MAEEGLSGHCPCPLPQAGLSHTGPCVTDTLSPATSDLCTGRAVTWWEAPGVHPKLSLGAFDCLKVYQGNCFLHHNAPCENLPTKTSPPLSLNLLVMALMVQNFSQKAEDQVLGVQQDGAKQLGSHHRASNTFTLFLDAKDISQHHSAQGVNEPLETGMSFGT